MLSVESMMLLAMKNHIRVNTSNKTVEIYDEYGVKLVLRDLSEDEYNAFKEMFINF